MAGKDYYKTLGVDKQSSAAEIKKKYRKLALKYHPDQNQGDKAAEQKFKEINEAYAVLSDADKRKKYDMFGADGFNPGLRNFAKSVPIAEMNHQIKSTDLLGPSRKVEVFSRGLQDVLVER